VWLQGASPKGETGQLAVAGVDAKGRSIQVCRTGLSDAGSGQRSGIDQSCCGAVSENEETREERNGVLVQWSGTSELRSWVLGTGRGT
jgi:hypothetical protein